MPYDDDYDDEHRLLAMAIIEEEEMRVNDHVVVVLF